MKKTSGKKPKKVSGSGTKRFWTLLKILRRVLRLSMQKLRSNPNTLQTSYFIVTPEEFCIPNFNSQDRLRAAYHAEIRTYKILQTLTNTKTKETRPSIQSEKPSFLAMDSFVMPDTHRLSSVFCLIWRSANGLINEV